MSKSAVIYSALNDLYSQDYVHYMLRNLQDEVDAVFVLVEQHNLKDADEKFGHFENVQLIGLPSSAARSGMSALKVGLTTIRDTGEDYSHVALTGNQVFGPIRAEKGWLKSITDATNTVWAPYWYNANLDPRLKNITKVTHLVTPDFIVFGKKVLRDPEFHSYVENLKPANDYWEDMRSCILPLNEFFAEKQYTVTFPIEHDRLETAQPSLFEIHKVVDEIGVTVPLSVFHLEPAQHDLNAIFLGQSLESIKRQNRELFDLMVPFIVRCLPSRDFNTIADQYDVISDIPASPDRTEWAFGKIAVFIHAYYSEMMAEFMDSIRKIPCEADLYITTSTQEDLEKIKSFLTDTGWPQDRVEVRLMHVNRGRDMSSLFITFRDVILSDQYEVALRLHSKRTPQVSRQVGDSFKAHLFENLVNSEGYVSNLLDMMEESPDVGLVIPPAIQIGFATLGHSWFNNRRPLQQLAKDMEIDVPLDTSTPVTAYGTMYWFRTDALKKMFAWKWIWDDYNPEPHHVDGGLAHVQERLIGLCVQDAGYRTMTVMTGRNAGRNYAKLEYKYQLLASYLNSGNILHQRNQLENLSHSFKNSMFHRLESIYGHILSRFPGLRRFLKPLASWLVKRLA